MVAIFLCCATVFFLESTGALNFLEGGPKHLDAGAKKVVLTASDAHYPTHVDGVNEGDYDPVHDVVASTAEEWQASGLSRDERQQDEAADGCVMTDQDGDGHVDPGFAEADQDGDGYVDPEELALAMGLTDDEDLPEGVEWWDQDDDGRLSMGEWLEWAAADDEDGG